MGDNADSDAVEKVVAAIFTALIDGLDQLRYAPTNGIQPLLDAQGGGSEPAYRPLTLGIFTPRM